MDDCERESLEFLINTSVPRVFRDRADPLDVIDDDTFRKRFRLSRRGFYSLLALLHVELTPSTTRSASISSCHKLAIFLEHIGSANMQRITAITLGCSQPTVSRIIAQVSDVLYGRKKDFIRWPDEEEQIMIHRKFFQLCGIPHVIGAIDGSHVKIIAPSVCEDSYVNRKDFHSINMGAICDSDQRFIWVNSKFPGRAHDSRVFKSSGIYNDFVTGRKTGILLADSAYSSERFVLKPILTENRTPAEARFTEALCRGRVIIENAFGSLKRQFLSLHTELRHNPTRAAKIIIAACCLRNYCINTRERPFNEDETVPQQHYHDASDSEVEIADMREGASMRRMIIERYFT